MVYMRSLVQPGLGNGQERVHEEANNILCRTLSFLPTPKQLPASNYTYDFEFPLPGHLPESTRVGNVYVVQYTLEAVVQRPMLFLKNYTACRAIHLSRRPEEDEMMLLIPDDFYLTMDQHPVAVADQWINKVVYSFSIPSKSAQQGSQIEVSGHIHLRTDTLQIRYLACYFKEYMSCRQDTRTLRSNKPRTHSRLIHYAQVKNSYDQFVIQIPIPVSPEDCQIDCLNDAVKIRHRLKFAISVMSQDGHVSELRVMLPIKIVPGVPAHHDYLPAYDDQHSSLPYDPAVMAALLQQHHHQQQQQQQSSTTTATSRSLTSRSCAPSRELPPFPRLPSYDEILTR